MNTDTASLTARIDADTTKATRNVEELRYLTVCLKGDMRALRRETNKFLGTLLTWAALFATWLLVTLYGLAVVLDHA